MPPISCADASRTLACSGRRRAAWRVIVAGGHQGVEVATGPLRAINPATRQAAKMGLSSSCEVATAAAPAGGI